MTPNPVPCTHHACSPYASFQAISTFILLAIFAVDIVLSFHLAYREPSQRRLVTDLSAIRMRYIR